MPRLAARAREVAASVIHGAHGRRRAGVGETFWQYRPAVIGEPAQRIDWRRSARSDQLYVRELEWEAARSFYLWMDASPSMAFKSSLAQDFKIDRAALLGLALADVLVRGGERVAALGLGPPIAARDIIERLARALVENLDTVAGWELAPLAAVPARAKIVLISDFLCEPGELAARLVEFADAGASGALLMIVDPAEESFPFCRRDPLSRHRRRRAVPRGRGAAPARGICACASPSIATRFGRRPSARAFCFCSITPTGRRRRRRSI